MHLRPLLHCIASTSIGTTGATSSVARLLVVQQRKQRAGSTNESTQKNQGASICHFLHTALVLYGACLKNEKQRDLTKIAHFYTRETSCKGQKSPISSGFLTSIIDIFCTKYTKISIISHHETRAFNDDLFSVGLLYGAKDGKNVWR